MGDDGHLEGDMGAREAPYGPRVAPARPRRRGLEGVFLQFFNVFMLSMHHALWLMDWALGGVHDEPG